MGKIDAKNEIKAYFATHLKNKSHLKSQGGIGRASSKSRTLKPNHLWWL